MPSFHLKNDELNNNSFNLPFCKIKEPRKTKPCESDS